ncbi:Calx-beta domain-containing protein [Moraxella bovis]|uniref:Calx-beta domain-containing protein n=1 Tax=Moraxella bovis TaxID=476 RepID=UPI002227604B|nr:Calx-beta domain-containing protein [Moraxella bovis]
MVPVTAKNVTIKVHSHVEQIKELTLATHDGQPDVIKADKNVNYEFFDHSIGRAPNHIIAKRKGKDLHVSFEREGQNDDLIIEGFFEDEYKALIGVAEDGHYYYYIPDTGEVADYVTQLQDADVEGQALGGEHHLTPLWLMLPTGTFPWWPLLGLGVIPFLGKDDDDKPAPTPDSVISTTNDSERGDGDNPVRVNVLKNDADNAVPETLRLIDPETGRPTTEKVVVSGQGTWELDPKEPGVVIFTPEKGYNGNPTPINYVVKNKEGKESQPTPVFIIYDASTTPDSKPGTPGQPVTQNVTNNDGDVDPSTVKLVDPNNPNNPPSNEVKVPGQGTWTVGPKPGEVTFTPEDGFTGDPDPIKYVVKDKDGNDLPPTDVDVSYPQLTNPDTKPGTPGQPVTQNVTNNDGDVDPSTVKLVDPNNPNNPPSNEVKVPGQGTWTVGPKPGEVTFTPEDGFTGDPDPIKYVVKDKDGKDLPPTSVDVTYPEPTQPTPTNPDTKPGTPGQPVTQNVTNNDGDVDPSTVKLVDPNNPNNPPSNEVKVPGQGTWTVGPKPGEVTFTPEDGFTGDPDPIKYVVKDKDGKDLPPTDVDVSYPQLTNPDTKPGTPGQPVTQNVTNNDGDVDPSTVKLVDPKTGEPTDKIVVPNEGTWTVGPKPGEVTFTPEDGFTGNPGPVNYYINDKSGNQLQPTPVAVTYPSKPVADVKKGEIGQPVPQKVTDNDENVDPSTVRLVDPVSKEPVPVGTPIKVPGQGTWTQDPNDPSVVIFTPNPGFEQSPTPINYIVKNKSGLDLKPTPVAVTYPTITTPDTKPGTPGQPVTQNVTNNDGDVDPSTVKLVDPNNPNNPPSNEVKVPGQGTWTVGPKPGEVTFTPEDGFTGDPDPIKYVVKDKDGKDLPPTSVDVTYPPVDPANPNPIATTPDSKSGYRGEPVTQNVTGNDNNVKPDTVKLVDPIIGRLTDKIVVPGQGTWTVGPKPGEVTFTPVPELGDKDPSPINYIVENDKEPGTFSKPTPVNITYPEIVKPKVSITGLTNVNEAVGEVEYTISLDKPAKENITVTYVTKAGTSTNPAEAADLKDGFVTKTVVIKAGETSATVKVGIVNDNEYEVAEDYNIAITKVEGNASIDTAKDNVTTTIHDDGKGTPDGRDPNNPDNINPNVPSDPAKPPFNPADPDNPDNNPDPRLPPTNPVPDADNDGPAKVSITGLTNVNEAVGEVEYTISLDKPAKENITVTYVTKAGTSTNPAEAADLKDGFVTKTVVIKAGETSATVKVGIVNDNEYEVAEDYNIAITKVEGNASIDTAKDNVTTTIHDDGKGTPDGRDPNNPDNINPNVPSDPAKPPFNPADPDNPDNNPDPRLPPTNPVPDADNDGPAKVSITGLTNVNEAVGEVEYTISLDKPAKENITVTYVTKAGTSTNPAEAADLKDGFVTKTVVIKAGETSATVKVGIVNDNEYEVAEDYNIAITKVEGNASIDAAKDNVTTTIHDDGKGTPDGRDPNNPDNINPNVPSDPAKPPFNPADPDNPDNNPDPRLPPTNPVPDADNDKPTVNLSGVRTVLESAGTAKYTFTLANGKTADKDVVIEYQVTVPANAAGINLAEAADFGNGTFGVTKTAIIKVGTSSVDINVPIINDEVYEGIETFVVNMTRVSDNASKGVDTVTTTINDFNGEVGVNKDKPVIKLDPPAHVSEEGLPGGNKDNDPVGVDKTNATTSDGEIRITSIDTSLSKNVTLALTKPTTIVTSGKQPVTWTTPDEGLTWIGRTPDDKPVLTIKLKEQIVKEGNTIAYKYTTELHAPIDHTEGDNKEDNLEVNFGIVVKDGKTEIARDNKIVTRVEDDSPVSGVSIHNIDVPVDDVRLMDIVTGFSNPDSSNETDKRYFVSTNNDKDVYAETIQWGNPSRNVQPRASYGIAEDVSMINKKLDGFNIPFSLGTFNHDNQGIYVNKGLESVNMHVDFVVSINGEKQTVKTIFDLKHIETPNKDYDNNDLLDNLIYGITPDDFVIFKPQETTLLIGGKRYTLKLNQPEKVSGNGELRDSVDNYDLLVKMEENYNTRGGSDDIRGVNSLYNTGAANLIKTQLDGITREDVVSGKVVIINTKEKANNGFKLSATLIPLDPNPDANNDLEHATNFRTGGDVVSDARLLDPNAQKVIWTLKDITDANKNIVDSDNNPSTFTFKTKYGTFIGNINGSYEFRGADNLAEVVDLGVEDRLVFGYTYQDNDGDSIQDTVVINFNDYAKETTGRTVNGTDDHDYIIGTTAAAADIIYGGKGDDTLIGELGADKLYGGEGNDKIVYDADDLVIDGGAGIDTLLLVSKPYKVGDEVKLDGNIDLTNTIATGFEVLDMNNGTAQNLTITAKDVLSINPEGRSLDVLGDGLDTVTLDGTFTKIDESTSEVKVGFDQYISNNGATLFISEEIKNIIM